MCGFIGFEKNKISAVELLEDLGMDDQLASFQDNPGTGPGAVIDIVVGDKERAMVKPATWWLLLDNQTLKPSQYTSFNTRSDKLDLPGTAGYQPYKESRCIIPATYIIEGMGPKQQRRYHRITPEHKAFALGGIYREWLNRETGETKLSCSVITLPPHPEWEGIHPKSTPLMLPSDNPELIEQWLDHDQTDSGIFRSLLTPSFRDELLCTPILKPSNQAVVGDGFRLGS